MYEDKYFRQWEGPFSFNSGTVHAKAPNEFGVYAILYRTEEEKLVTAYVGIGTGATIRERLKRHVSSSHNWALKRTTDPGNYYFACYICDAVTAKQIESHITCTAKPPYNVKRELKHFIPSISVH